MDTSEPRNETPPPRLFPLPNLAPNRPARRMDPTPSPSPDHDLSRDPSEPPSPDQWPPDSVLEHDESPTDSPPTPTSTRRRPGGEPHMVAQVLGGLLLLLTGTLGVLLARQGRTLRQPTPAQRDGMAEPVARIAVRHLPLDALGPDLADATAAVVAVHGYIADGALITQVRAEPINPDNESSPA